MGILHQLTRRIVWRRLSEPSTWAGLVGLVAGLSGITLSDDEQQAYVALGIALAGVLQIFVREASPSQVAKSALNAAEGDTTDGARVREAVATAQAREDDPPWHVDNRTRGTDRLRNVRPTGKPDR